MLWSLVVQKKKCLIYFKAFTLCHQHLYASLKIFLLIALNVDCTNNLGGKGDVKVTCEIKCLEHEINLVACETF